MRSPSRSRCRFGNERGICGNSTSEKEFATPPAPEATNATGMIAAAPVRIERRVRSTSAGATAVAAGAATAPCSLRLPRRRIQPTILSNVRRIPLSGSETARATVQITTNDTTTDIAIARPVKPYEEASTQIASSRNEASGTSQVARRTARICHHCRWRIQIQRKFATPITSRIVALDRNTKASLIF